MKSKALFASLVGILTAMGLFAAPAQAQPLPPGSVALPELPVIAPIPVATPLGSSVGQLPPLPFPFFWATDPFGGRTSLIDCGEKPSKLSETIVIACGDGNLQYKNIRWSDWTDGEANGAGEMWYSDCVPSCYNGTFHRDPVTLRLHDVREVNGVQAFTGMTVRRGQEVWEQAVSGFQARP